MPTIHYTNGYKYQLVRGYRQQLDRAKCPPSCALLPFIRLSSSGVLEVTAGYAWDGPSGPTIDTKNFMRGSLVHDALYQLMREGYVRQSFRKYADDLLYDMCRADGMSWLRAQYVFGAVRTFSASAARLRTPTVYQAP